jgi:hypothetical protein
MPDNDEPPDHVQEPAHQLGPRTDVSGRGGIRPRNANRTLKNLADIQTLEPHVGLGALLLPEPRVIYGVDVSGTGL